MIAIARTFEWDMGHRVTNHDSLCKNPHGHRYKLELAVSGPLNEQAGDASEGMVLDFGQLKRAVNEQVVNKLDHAFMYWQEDAVMRKFADENKDLKLLDVPFVPTAECIAEYLATEVNGLLTDEFPSIQLQELTVYETPTCKAIWRRQ